MTAAPPRARLGRSHPHETRKTPEVGPLDPDAARAAIAIPARNEGVSFDDGAVDAILQATQNYPYFIQEWGFQVWNRAPSSPIAREAVADATPDVIAHLDANFSACASIA